MTLKITTIPTQPFSGQKFGTSGIRKLVKVFMQEHYLNNILWSIFTVCNFENKNIVLGGDGRYFNKEAIIAAIKMLVACNVKKIYIGQNGWFSTPALSLYIKTFNLDYGIIFSASHNPAGKDGDFGIKINSSNGSGIEKSWCDKIYEFTKKITHYDMLNNLDLDINKIQKVKVLNTEIEVVDPVAHYMTSMENIFDFNKIHTLFKHNFTMLYEGFNAITGIYAKDIFYKKLGVPLDHLRNITPLEDFGQHHADPNSLYAKHLIELSKTKASPDILFASDGDGDRNLIIGKDTMVSPCDSLAIILKYAHLIPFYKNLTIKGVARSMPTSRAVDAVAKSLGVNCYEVPTGWRFFGNLLENNLITFCGEESYGTGSAHCGEKDGIWAMLFWLNILAELKIPVKQIVSNLWQQFGRYYFIRLDYFNIPNEVKEKIFHNFLAYNNQTFLQHNITSKEFIYSDEFTKEPIKNNGLVMYVGKDIRLILRASGTDSTSITLRLYIDKYEGEVNKVYEDKIKILEDLSPLINSISLNTKPSIID